METSVPPDSQRSPNFCIFRNKTGESCNQPSTLSSSYSVTPSPLSSTFAARVTHHFHREHPQHTSELSSPRCHPFTPEEGLYSSSMQCANSPQATQMLLIFTATPLCLFYEGLPEQDSSLGLGKKRPDSCQKRLVVEKQWHALCDSPCSPNPRRPPRRNPPFLLFVRSWLPLPIAYVSFGPGTLRWPDQHGRVSCQEDGEERKREWEKCFNCCKNSDCLRKFVWEMCG